MEVIVYKKKEKSYSVNGLEIAAICYGDEANKPMIALHGWLDNAASFALLAPLLPDYYIVALDFAGHGLSDHRPQHADYYLWENVKDLYAVFTQLGLDKVDLIGHSMGASIAMLFASCFSEHVENLILIEGVAPLHYTPDELPSLMAQGIKRHLKTKPKKSGLKIYENIETLIQTRMASRFPVSYIAAEYLVKRGCTESEQGVYWSSDSQLIKPSVLRFSQDQIIGYLKAVQAKVIIFVANQGLCNDSWVKYWSYLANVEVNYLEGNHHLHMQDSGVEKISARIKEIIPYNSVC